MIELAQPIYIEAYPTCDGRCQYAISEIEKCTCTCRGKYHGYVYTFRRKNNYPSFRNSAVRNRQQHNNVVK